MISKIRQEKAITMNRIVLLIFFATMTNIFAQTTYYVSFSEGNDNNSGTSAQLAWKTISKLNNTTFQPGDQILFKRNDKWDNTEGLLITSSGTQTNRITFGAYGDGSKPIISLISEVEGWNNPNNWVSYSPNVWYMIFPTVPLGSGVEGISRLWLDGIEYPRAKGLNESNLNQLSGEPETFGVNAKHRYHHQVYSSVPRLYVFTNGSNPANFYSSIKYAGYYSPILGTVSHTIELRNADYVTIKDLDIRGGMYSPISLNGSDYVIIDNCDIGPSEHAGIIADRQHSSDKTSDFVEIKNCNIDSYRKVKVNFYDGGVEYGITTNNANYWNIHHNTIKNWSFGFLPLAGYGNSTGHKFYDNDVSAPDIEYGKGIQFGGDNEQFINNRHEIFNNYFHDLKNVGILFNANTANRINNIKVFFNLFSNITKSESEHADQDNSGFGIQGLADSTWIFNNTFYRTNGQASFLYNCDSLRFINNLMVNVRQAYTYHVALAISNNQKARYINNGFFQVGYSTSNYLLNIGTIPYTVGQFSGLIGGKILASSNVQGIGDINNHFITSNFTLPTSSFAFGTGSDISQLIPPGFKDRSGNLVNRTNPSIGAIQNNPNSDLTPPQLISASLLDSARLLLTFSEPLSSVGITTLSNYIISNGILIQSAQLNTNQSQVILLTSIHSFGQNYSIVVNNLKDLAGNIIQSSSNSATYQCNFNPPTTGELIKLPIIQATASSAIGANYGPDKTIDGKYYSNGGDTCWAARPMPQWLIYDLGTPKQISKTKVSFYDFENGRLYIYKISVSNDFVNWNTIIQNATSSSQEWTVNNFNPVLARYIKIDLIGNNQNDYAVVWETEIWGYNSAQTVTMLNCKTFLQGAYQNGSMVDILNTSGVIPFTQPYNSPPWNYYGNESVQSIPPDVVDWVLVEFRSDTSANSVSLRRAAFITKNGKIVDLDGMSSLGFYGVNNNYYIVIMHRNHLSIMSANKLNFSEPEVNYDFTTSNTAAFGNSLAELDDGKFGMFAGDGDGNGVVNVLDYQTVGNNLFQVGYKAGDLDLNNIINILDYGKTNQNLLKFSKVPGTVIF